MRQTHAGMSPDLLPQSNTARALGDLARAYEALDAVSAASASLAPYVDRAVAQLHDLAWITRSRSFDGELRPLVDREVVRAGLAAAVLVARHEKAGSDGLNDAIDIFETHVRRGVAALRQARVNVIDNAPPPARASLRPLRAAPDIVSADRDQMELDRAAA